MEILVLLPYLLVLLSGIRLSSGHTYLSPSQDEHSWKVLNQNDILSLSDLRLDEKLTKIAVELLPNEDGDNDLLDHYIDESSFIKESESAIIACIKDHFEEVGDESDPEAFFRTMYYDTIRDSVKTALESRNNKILQYRSSRKDNYVQKQLSLIGQSLKDNIDDKFEIVDMVDMSCKILRHFSTVPTIKKVLSYPIVGEEILLALTKDKHADGVWYDTILQAVAPFLREAINEYDVHLRANRSREVAVTEVAKALKSPICVTVTKGIMLARRYDNFLHDMLNDKNQYLTEMVEAYLIHFRKSITYFLYYSPKEYQRNSLNGLVRRQLRNIIKSVTGVQHEILGIDIVNLRINASLPVSRKRQSPASFERIQSMQVYDHIHKKLLKRTNASLESEFTTYIQTQEHFQAKDCSKLTEIGRQLLISKYNQLNEKNFNIHNSLIHNHQLSSQRIDSNMVHSFHKELESNANMLLRFPSGSFIYSRAYLNVLSVLFPSIVNPFKDQTVSFQEKQEL